MVTLTPVVGSDSACITSTAATVTKYTTSMLT